MDRFPGQERRSNRRAASRIAASAFAVRRQAGAAPGPHAAGVAGAGLGHDAVIGKQLAAEDAWPPQLVLADHAVEPVGQGLDLGRIRLLQRQVAVGQQLPCSRIQIAGQVRARLPSPISCDSRDPTERRVRSRRWATGAAASARSPSRPANSGNLTACPLKQRPDGVDAARSSRDTTVPPRSRRRAGAPSSQSTFASRQRGRNSQLPHRSATTAPAIPASELRIVSRWCPVGTAAARVVPSHTTSS